MATSLELYRLWSSHPYFDAETHQELATIAGDEHEIDDRFYRSLEFGTGGLRGVIASGTNRMNRYTVRHATQGLADYLGTFGDEARKRGVVIAFDSRWYSAEYALEAALTLNASGVVAYLWDSLRPTPILSFAVRELHAMAGVVITASHNPSQYNGYKVYWEDGSQVPPERAGAIQAAIRAVADLTTVCPMGTEQARAAGLLKPVPPAVDRAYTDRLLALVRTEPEQRHSCRVLYTPLHGAGNRPVRQVLTEAGYHVSVVADQEQPDPSFPTVRSPNPEDVAVFALALTQAATELPDVIMATDPDADRLGAMVRDKTGDYRLLTGNQIGAILVDYLVTSHVEAGTLPANPAVVKTIATSNMVASLLRAHGVALLETHTGFKFIGDKVREFEETGSHTFLFGFEESYGYLGASFVRDKDAVMASLLLAEAAAHHKGEGRTLHDALESIWQRFGCFLEGLHNVTLPGREGQAEISAKMEMLRSRPPRALGGLPVAFTDDYSSGTGVDHTTGSTYPLALGQADVLHFRFADGGFVMVRPSGTEPKLKLYFSVCGQTRNDAEVRLEEIRAEALSVLGLTEEG